MLPLWALAFGKNKGGLRLTKIEGLEHVACRGVPPGQRRQMVASLDKLQHRRMFIIIDRGLSPTARRSF